MTIKYDDYKIIANKISYWLLKNNKNIKKRKEYKLSGKKAPYNTVKATILKNKDTTNGWGRKFLETAITDNKNLKEFPNTVTYKNKTYTKAEYKYMAEYVREWWKTHTKRPVTIPIKAPNKKHGHSKTHGCDNMGQNTPYYCGCHSLQEVVRNLTGKIVKQSTIASICGTTTAGTDHNGLNTFIAWFNREYGFDLKVEWKNFSDIGWNGIKKIVESDNQDCIIHNLYRNKYGHYEVVNTVSSNNIRVQNSLGDKCTSTCYCGYVENRTPTEYHSYINGISQKSIMVVTK